MSTDGSRPGAQPTAADAATQAAITGGYEQLERIQRYGKYFLVRKIAEGGMAEIFLAKQVGAEGFERNVVIKRMLRYLSEDQSFVSMFLDEAKLAAQLAHQNIVQINELGLAEGCYFIAMEYLAGEDLSSVVRAASRKGLYVPIPIVLKVLADAAVGLHFAHEFTDSSGQHLKIVHRDISPSNIFVTYAGGVKVLDFGIARAESRTTKTSAGVVKGKYMYMSPEQARGSANAVVDRRSDVFSLGVSLYESLTCTRPFHRDNDLAVLNAVLQGEFKHPRQVRADIPEELERIVLKAMAAKVEERYQSSAALAADLEKYLAATGGSPNGTAISTYLTGLFGEDRIRQRSRIESLPDIVKSGRSVPGFTDPEMKTVATTAATEGATRAIGPPSSVTNVTRRRTGLFAAVAVAVIAAAGGGGYLAVRGAGRGSDSSNGSQGGGGATAPSGNTQTPVVVTPPSNPNTTVALNALVDAGNGLAADAGVVAASGTEGSNEDTVPADVKGPKHPTVSAKPIKLTVAEIQKVVSTHSSTIMKCFDQHKADLPSDSGKVIVQFGILSSGKVGDAAVQGPLASASVGKCLEQRVKGLKFPAHVDKEVKLALPFAYTVQR